MRDNWLQHVNVKFPARSSEVDVSGAIAVFHRWIQEQDFPGLLIDVADYQHVPNGPGIMLVAHDAIYSLDQHGGRLGLLYNRRTKLEEFPAVVLRQAFRATLEVCRKLESEPEFLGALEFECQSCEVVINDRALAPNNYKMASQLNHEYHLHMLLP